MLQFRDTCKWNSASRRFDPVRVEDFRFVNYPPTKVGGNLLRPLSSRKPFMLPRSRKLVTLPKCHRAEGKPPSWNFRSKLRTSDTSDFGSCSSELTSSSYLEMCGMRQNRHFHRKRLTFLAEFVKKKGAVFPYLTEVRGFHTEEFDEQGAGQRPAVTARFRCFRREW